MGSEITLPITSGASGAVAAHLIIVADGSNAGNGKVSTAAAQGFVGVTTEVTDTLGYTTVRTRGIARVRAGGTVVAGNQIASDAVGKGVAITPAASGASVKQVAGTALSSCANGELFDLLINPQLALGA